MVRSRFNLIFYVLTLFSSAGMVLACYLMMFYDQVFVFLLFLLGACLILTWRVAFFLRIMPDQLYVWQPFSGRYISDSEIQGIALWDQKTTKVGKRYGITIETVYGRTFRLNAVRCANMPEIRRALLERYGELVQDHPVRVPRPVIDDAVEQEFRGNRVFNKSVFCFFFVILFSVFGELKLVSITSRLTLGIFVVLVWLLLGYQLFYFRLLAGNLIVRNQFFPWFERVWPLDEIDSVLFEDWDEGPNVLSLQMYDLRLKRYTASTLRDKHWNALGDGLQRRGVPVRNEMEGVDLTAENINNPNL